jgi:hypothetical protein
VIPLNASLRSSCHTNLPSTNEEGELFSKVGILQSICLYFSQNEALVFHSNSSSMEGSASQARRAYNPEDANPSKAVLPSPGRVLSFLSIYRPSKDQLTQWRKLAPKPLIVYSKADSTCRMPRVSIFHVGSLNIIRDKFAVSRTRSKFICSQHVEVSSHKCCHETTRTRFPSTH